MENPMNTHGTDDDSLTVVLPEWTYFIRDAEGIKIGRSMSPQARMRDLQAGNGSKMELLLAVPYSQLSEPDAHRKFKHLRTHREWFRPEPELLQFIESLKPKPRPLSPHEPLIGQLRTLRHAHGHKSAIGCHCSNIIELLALPKPPAALLERQMAGLQRAWAQMN